MGWDVHDPGLEADVPLAPSSSVQLSGAQPEAQEGEGGQEGRGGSEEPVPVRVRVRVRALRRWAREGWPAVDTAGSWLCHRSHSSIYRSPAIAVLRELQTKGEEATVPTGCRGKGGASQGPASYLLSALPRVSGNQRPCF